MSITRRGMVLLNDYLSSLLRNNVYSLYIVWKRKTTTFSTFTKGDFFFFPWFTMTILPLNDFFIGLKFFIWYIAHIRKLQR